MMEHKEIFISMTVEDIYIFSSLINDEILEVRSIFKVKLDQTLSRMPQYLAISLSGIYLLGGLEAGLGNEETKGTLIFWGDCNNIDILFFILFLD